MQLLPFNLSFPRICIRLLPRHLSTSLLFSALLALLCSTLYCSIQLHSYTATQLYTATYTVIYTAIQLHRYIRTDYQTARRRVHKETTHDLRTSASNINSTEEQSSRTTLRIQVELEH